MSIYKHPKLREAFDIYVREQNARLPSEEELAGIVLSDEFKAVFHRAEPYLLTEDEVERFFDICGITDADMLTLDEIVARNKK